MQMILTNNFYSWVRMIILQSNTNITSSTSTASGTNSAQATIHTITPLIDKTGVERTSIYLWRSDEYQDWSSLNSWVSGTKPSSYQTYTYFSIGTREETAKETDYSLQEDYVQGVDYSAIWRAVSNPQKTKNNTGILTFSITITAINDISISEIGMFKQLEDTNMSYNHFLLGRAVFNKITVPSGESRTFQLSIEL